MKISECTQPDCFDQLRAEWSDLLRRSPADSIFTTWEWQKTWWDSYCPGELWLLACRDDQNRLIGIAPWFIEPTPPEGERTTIERTVRTIGCVDVTDYLDLIIDRDHYDAVLGAFVDHLIAHASRYDVIDLCNLPELSPTREKLRAQLEAKGFTVEIKQQEVCPIIQLPDSFETYIESLEKKQRQELRRKIRRAEAADEQVTWYIVGKEHDLTEELNRFLELMAASSPDKAAFLQNRQHVAFFRNVMPLMNACGWLQLSFLTIDGKAAASYLNFDYDGHILVYNSGLSYDEYAHLSPGIVLLAYNIRHAIEQGRSVFDFLRGNEVYKYRMGGVDSPVYMLRAVRAES